MHGGFLLANAGQYIPLLLSDACFRGRHTGQSCLRQFFQCEMICRDEAQWATNEKENISFYTITK